MLTDLDHEFLRLVEVDPGNPEPLGRVLFDAGQADVYGYVLHPAMKRAVLAINRGLYDELCVIDVESGALLQSLELPAGIAFADNVSDVESQLAWSLDGERLFVAWETPTAPSEIYELPGGTRWTMAGGAALPGAREPVPATYRSFDGLQIPALHYRVDGRPDPRSSISTAAPKARPAATSTRSSSCCWRAASTCSCPTCAAAPVTACASSRSTTRSCVGTPSGTAAKRPGI